MIPTAFSAFISLVVLAVFVAGVLAIAYVGYRMLRNLGGDDAP